MGPQAPLLVQQLIQTSRGFERTELIEAADMNTVDKDLRKLSPPTRKPGHLLFASGIFLKVDLPIGYTPGRSKGTIIVPLVGILRLDVRQDVELDQDEGSRISTWMSSHTIFTLLVCPRCHVLIENCCGD